MTSVVNVSIAAVFVTVPSCTAEIIGPTGCIGTTAFEAVEAVEVPALLLAVTVKV
jgi:hypothetical protein